jgi:hypothetical protein
MKILHEARAGSLLPAMGRIFSRKTGVHFSGKCSKANPSCVKMHLRVLAPTAMGPAPRDTSPQRQKFMLNLYFSRNETEIAL